MAVELSGDTGAAMQSYIHVQSVRSNTTCHNNYDRTIETIFCLTVPQVFPLIGLGSLQSHCHFSQLHYLVAQSNFHRLCFSYFVAPKGSSHRVSMATPCRRDKVISSECLSELSLILMVTLFIRILMIYPSLMCLIADWIQVCVMSPDCGPLWGCAVAHKAHCIYNLAL